MFATSWIRRTLIAELSAHALDKEGNPILAGSTEAVTAGPQTDADAGYIAEDFEPFGDPAVIQPGVALEAVASHHGAEQSAMDPVGVTYFGPHPSASRAMFMDQSSERGSELGGFADPCLPRQSFERVVTSNWGGPTLTTTSAQTSTTALTSVACLAIGGPAHAFYACSLPQAGLTSICPARQVMMKSSV